MSKKRSFADADIEDLIEELRQRVPSKKNRQQDNGYLASDVDDIGDALVEEHINDLVGDLIMDGIIDKIRIDDDVFLYSFSIKYPNNISVDQVRVLRGIKNIVKAEVDESQQLGVLKVLLTYTTSPRMKIRYSQQDKLTTSKSTDGNVLMDHITSSVTLDTESELLKSEKVIEKGITVVTLVTHIKCPVRYEQLARICTNEIIKDVKLIPDPSSVKVRMIFDFFKED